MFSAGMPVGGPDEAAWAPFPRGRPLPSPFMFALARPPQAIIAMFNLLFRFRPRRKAGAPAITPAAARAPPSNSRRVT